MIWGEQDRLPVPSIAARAAQVKAARPDAEIHILPGAGHWVQYEAPRAVENLVGDFQKRMFT